MRARGDTFDRGIVPSIASLLTIIFASLSSSVGLAENLVANPSFEQQAGTPPFPEEWRADRQVYAADKSVHHGGETALRFVNQDPGRYTLCRQTARLEPGWKCRFSVWVKTKDLVGQESGATICLEWSDRNGKWLGGCYPTGVKGTTDWTRIEGVARLPKEAGACHLNCYVRKGMTGTAWFDDVELQREFDPIVQTMILSPAYRGTITAQGPAEVRTRLRLNLTDYDLKPRDLTLSYRLQDQAGQTALENGGLRLAEGQPTDFAFPTRGLKPGKYRLEVWLSGPDGKRIQTDWHDLLRAADDFRPRSWIDAKRRLVVDGKPMFPLGMYFSSIDAKDLDLYSQGKFNCLMPYGSPSQEQLDLAQKHGLKVIYSVKDLYAGSEWAPKNIRTVEDEEREIRARVRRFREHPALLAWYLNDELPQSYLPRLEAHQRWVAEEDPGHPTWVVLYQYREVGAYRNTFDVIGTDPYPIGRSPASMAAEWTAETLRQVESARPVWQVPQVHNWANYATTAEEKQRCHTPTFDELRSMAWQCIAEGATGLVFYSWYDLKRNPDVPFDQQWDGLKRIAAEIDQASPILLSDEDPPAVSARGVSGDQQKPRWLHVLARRQAGKIYIFAVNDGDGEGTAVFTLPGQIGSVRDLTTHRTMEFRGQEFQDGLKKLSVAIYEITPAAR
jgi:hypothetical protein